MIIKKLSPLTGRETSMDLPITDEQLFAWSNGAPIQDVMPHLTDDQREFIMTGYTKDDWDALFEEDSYEDAMDVLAERGLEDD